MKGKIKRRRNESYENLNKRIDKWNNKIIKELKEEDNVLLYDPDDQIEIVCILFKNTEDGHKLYLKTVLVNSGVPLNHECCIEDISGWQIFKL
jgi:selenocysteine lyase/cysteine desulfurase